MKKIISALLAALMTFSSAAALADGLAAPELIEPVGVKLDTAEVKRQDIYQLKYFDAAVVPYVEKLSFVVDGKIESINVLAGDMVKKGDVLATLNQDAIAEHAQQLSEEIDYLSKELEFSRREGQLQLSIEKLKLEKLRAEAGGTADAIKLKEADIALMSLKYEQQAEADKFKINTLIKQLASTREKLGSNEITAPFDGRIVYMNLVQPDSSIKAYEPMFFIADDTKLHIDSAYVNEASLNSANEVYAHIGSADYAITPHAVDWHEAVAVALAGGELRSAFDFTDADKLPEDMESGRYAAVILKTGLVKDALVVPANAMYSDGMGRYVYKLVDGKRVRAQVTVGRMTSTMVQIKDGLEEGELVYVKE